MDNKHRTLKKFGICANDGPGPSDSTTSRAPQEIKLEFLINKQGYLLSSLDEYGLPKKRGEEKYVAGQRRTKKRDSDEETKSSGVAKYRPPGARGEGQIPVEEYICRVTNLREGENAEELERDLREKFQTCGTIERVYVPRVRDTNESRGLALITFSTKEELDKAINKFHRHKMDNLIMAVERGKSNKEIGKETPGKGQKEGA